MKKYYTRACNFFYGSNSQQLIKKKIALPLCGNTLISFNKIEIFIRGKNNIKSKIINIKEIKKLPRLLRLKVSKDLKKMLPD